MWRNIDEDQHFIGLFKVVDEQMQGEIVYNGQNGTIILNLKKELKTNSIIGKSYGKLPIITGKINSGAVVTLFNNRCRNNQTYVLSSQQLSFVSDYLIWSNTDETKFEYNKIVCYLENAFQWSCFSVFEEAGTGIQVKDTFDKKVFNWFGAKVIFSCYLNNSILTPPQEEETKIVQRLVVEIETIEKRGVKDFIRLRNRILSLISFAIKDNVNVEEQYLCDNDDTFFVTEGLTEYHKYYLYTSEPTLDLMKRHRWDYNFSLKDLSEESDINEVLEKLEPILNLYLSLFKYREMPLEMVFLNIVQALETFHSRFFYNDRKKEYIESVKKRFSDNERYEKLLISEAQANENCDYIILVSRLNDLLIRGRNGLFLDYFLNNEGFAQTIVDTRHYYTHYGKSKEQKALKGDDLLEAIFVLRVLLEYHICLVLGVDIRDAIVRQKSTHDVWKQISEVQSRESNAGGINE